MKIFERFADSGQMEVLFQKSLPGYAKGLHLITECRILCIQHPPELNADLGVPGLYTIRYQLKVTDSSRQHQGIQLLFAKVYPEGRSQDVFRKINTDLLTSPRFGAAVVLLPELEMVVWAFPNDARLPHLPKLTFPTRVKNYIPYEHLPSGFDRPENVKDVTVDIIRYHPEDRCTFRVNLKMESSESTKALTLYGKTFHNDQGMELYRLTHSIWTMSIKPPESFIIAQPLSYDKKLKTLWQMGLSGTPLRDIVDLENCEDFLESVAKGLACLHRLEFPHSLHHGTFDQLDDILEKIDTVMKQLPELSQQLGSIVSGIKEGFPRLTKITDRPVHGSFRIKEILVCEKGLAVFDFDKVSMGDWVRDLALFLADLHLIYADAALVQQMSRAFFQAYRAQVDWELPVDRLKWHIRVQYLKKIVWIYKNKRLDPRLEARIQKVMTLIQQGTEIVWK